MKHPIQKWREEHGLSQTDAAKILGCTQGAISHIEIGRNMVSRENAKEWSEATGGELDAAELILFEFPERFKDAA